MFERLVNAFKGFKHERANAVVKYKHHGALVFTKRVLKGKHRSHCLCFNNCTKFKPGTKQNCKRAATLFKFCVKNNMVTPVFECPDYSNK